MTIRVLAVAVAVAVSAAGQPSLGNIGGRITDANRGSLPGVRVRLTNGDFFTSTVTDSDGRFAFEPVPMGRYHVVADLAGFRSSGGDVTLSAATPRIFLNWPMDPGCLHSVDRIIVGPKAAAPLADTIVHIRVVQAAGPVRLSDRPDCEGRLFREYSVRVIASAAGTGHTMSAPQPIFMDPHEADLTPGQEYLALLWRDGHADRELMLPIVSGRVMSADTGELNGLPVYQALALLSKWAEEGRQ